MTDFIIVLRTNEAVRTFGGNVHFSIGAGLSAAVGIVGRAAGADLRAGDGGYAACYTYSCSKGTYCPHKCALFSFDIFQVDRRSSSSDMYIIIVSTITVVLVCVKNNGYYGLLIYKVLICSFQTILL